MNEPIIFLYGPSGSGKSTAGEILAKNLDIPFVDLDKTIVQKSGQSIPEIFQAGGEAGFRALELQILQQAVQGPSGVIALGGGALLNPEARKVAETHGQIYLLTAETDLLFQRLKADPQERPLLNGGGFQRLEKLINLRSEHYQSFAVQIDTGRLDPAETAWQIQILAGRFRIHVPGSKGRPGQEAYDVLVQSGGLQQTGDLITRRGLRGPILVISDDQVGPLYAEQVVSSITNAGYTCRTLFFGAGEKNKRMETMSELWDACLSAGLERASTILGLGGGVVTDMAGFAAATYLRGIRWVSLPTSLLGMVDASLGGKTGIDLERGKNLVGSFHSPALVLADPNVLSTLPISEIRSGLAETIKHGVIADPILYADCEHLDLEHIPESLIRRAISVKARVVEMDPFEQNRRAALNLGHTIGHAVEQASDFSLRHGDAVAIGMVVETLLAERLGLAEKGLSEKLILTLSLKGLPTHIPPELDPKKILNALLLDKKKTSGKVKFALPVKIGEVITGIEVDEERINHAIGAGVTRS